MRLNTTKLFRPGIPDDYVPRRELDDRLKLITHRPLALVSAPAGYGKTTAVSAWVAASGLDHCWFSVDETDNDFSHFLSYFLGAVRRAIPTVGETLEKVLESSSPPSAKRFVEYIDLDLVDNDRPVVMVLDDFQVINNAEVLEVIRELMRHPHPALHLVVISRHDPQLPLSAWRARNQLVDIRAADLRFNLEETNAFLLGAVAESLDQQMIAGLHAQTEGWPAGLRLAALSFSYAGGDIRDQLLEISGNNQQIFEFLTEQVLAGLPDHLRSFLMQTSILERLSGRLCEAVVSPRSIQMDGHKILHQLNRDNLFLIPLDGEERWFRYHHLFAEFLQVSLKQEYSEEEVAGLHLKASRWFAAAGFLDEAIRYAIMAGAMEEAAGLLAESRHDLLNQEHFGRLLSLLNLFPESVIRTTPELLLVKAWCAHTIRFDIAEVGQLSGEIDALIDRLELEPAEAERLRAENDILRGIPPYFELDPATVLARCGHGLEVVPKAHYVTRSFAWVYSAAAHHMKGDYNGIMEVLRVSRYEDMTAPNFPRARNAGAAGYPHWMDADLTAVKRVGDYILALATSTNQPVSASWGHYFLASAYYHWNDLAEARAHAEQVFSSRQVNRGFYSIHAGIILALVHQASGDQALARETLAQTYHFAFDLRSPPLIATVEACQVELAIRQGQGSTGAQWARQVLPQMRLTALPLFYAPPLTVAKALLAAKHPADMPLLADYLTEWREHLESIHNARFLIEILALEAMFHDARGDKPTALSALERSLDLAEPSGFIRLYADLGLPMKSLLERFSSQGGQMGYIKRILDAFPDTKPAQSVVLIEPLTDRELQVLGLLAERLSNKEIAQQLVIAPVTVKRHTINIYQKLSVQSRRDAVQTAQKLGLLG